MIRLAYRQTGSMRMQPMDKKKLQAQLRELPSVDNVLSQDAIRKQVEHAGIELVTFIVRAVIEDARKGILNHGASATLEEIVKKSEETIALMTQPLLKEVINATGIVIHTNLGRAPLGKKVLEDIATVTLGYSNLEYDLKTAQRGRRSDHVVPLITYLAKAEDAVVVNNNAAGIMLTLNTLARGKEVIISRGELIEIGDSFRIPEILAASGSILVEVGTTNKTKLSDYDKAITGNTAMIVKAHRSNFDIVGFTEEVSVQELANLAHKRGLVFLYDIGSGLIRKPKNLPLENEPDVESAVAAGADLVAFSGDKLLGGPQAGIVVGKKEYIAQIRTAPMMRALRVDKLTLAALGSVTRSYVTDTTLRENIPLFSMLGQSDEVLKQRAEELSKKLHAYNVSSNVVKSTARCGGGTLPSLEIPSYAVTLLSGKRSQKERSLFAERIFNKLHHSERPIIGILRQGEILFDVLTLADEDLSSIAEAISRVLGDES
jgi:L-seryl-tRNA(Ser) seleniumtransferase